MNVREQELEEEKMTAMRPTKTHVVVDNTTTWFVCRWNIVLVLVCLTMYSCVLIHWWLTAGSLPRRPHTLEDASLPHGVEFFDRVILLVEVSVGLFPGLCHCVLTGKHRRDVGFRAEWQFVSPLKIYLWNWRVYIKSSVDQVQLTW